MGKYDKDRYQKELSIRYCLAMGLIPFPEVVVRSVADVSETVEVLTDIDVLGVGATGDGYLYRVVFDCKSGTKLSSINRAFWAAGVKQYSKCDDAFVLLKGRSVHNHRISALSMGVDLHDEESFKDLGKTYDPAFPSIDRYQAEMERWNSLFDGYQRNAWSESLYDLARNVAPLSRTPWSTFRKIVAELRATRGHFDPRKEQHVAILLDVLASSFVLWSAMSRDIRRFYEPSMSKQQFEKALRYYIWGGREAYEIRQQMKDRSSSNDPSVAVELPAWDLLVNFASLIIASPQSVLSCAVACREISLRIISGKQNACEQQLSQFLKTNARVRQFSASLTDYIVAAANLPREFAADINDLMFKA